MGDSPHENFSERKVLAGTLKETFFVFGHRKKKSMKVGIDLVPFWKGIVDFRDTLGILQGWLLWNMDFVYGKNTWNYFYGINPQRKLFNASQLEGLYQGSDPFSQKSWHWSSPVIPKVLWQQVVFFT